MRDVALIERISSDPAAGAFRCLRTLDPLYQAEIGEPRMWEVRLEKHCPRCGGSCCLSERRYLKTEAVTAKDALAEAAGALRKDEYLAGVRVAGSGSGFWEEA